MHIININKFFKSKLMETKLDCAYDKVCHNNLITFIYLEIYAHNVFLI